MAGKRAFLAACAVLVGAASCVAAADAGSTEARPATVTPIRHLAVTYQENVSFGHYFGTYPRAANTDGQPFAAAANTPAVDGLLPVTDASLPASLRHSDNLLATNPNSALPQRLDSSSTGLAGGAGGGQLTCDQDHTTATSRRRLTVGRWICSCRASAPTAARSRLSARPATPRRSWTTTTATPSRRFGTTRSGTP
jgi:phospholipase C